MFKRARRWFAFNAWYLLGNPPWDTGITPPELLEFLQKHQPGRALDLGCGTGKNVQTLAEAGWQVTGVDFALVAIARARMRLRRAGLQADLRVGDVMDLHDLSGSYDLILDIGCYHGLTPTAREAYRRNLSELLAPGGYFLLYAFIRQEDSSDWIGIDLTEIRQFGENLAMVQREDSLDSRGRRSTWVTYEAEVRGS